MFSDSPKPTLSSEELHDLNQRFPLVRIATETGQQIAFRSAGTGPVTVVCLHGIGSGSASWINVARQLPSGLRLIAWDAPGYGESSSLTAECPKATDYAHSLANMLQILGVHSCVLIGHSLGAMVASAYAREAERNAVKALLLISPAQGYGATAKKQTRNRILNERISQLENDGVVNMAVKRSSRLLSNRATEADRKLVIWNMVRLHDRGYRQAVNLLCNDDLTEYLPPPEDICVQVACGTEDIVTTPESCAQVARRCGRQLIPIENAGHACYVEQSGQVLNIMTTLIRTFRETQ
ncbi:alpha/beta fold hydrolase [Advenella kashmirensis]|nr:alpha/beta hydrolase [Advenella kashmirensis]